MDCDGAQHYRSESGWRNIFRKARLQDFEWRHIKKYGITGRHRCEVKRIACRNCGPRMRVDQESEVDGKSE
jgi:hypothetical protein